MTMGLIPLGNYFGYTLTKDRPISSGRSFLIETTGIMGTITGFLLPTLFEAETKNAYLAMGLLGHAAGTALGFNYHKSQDYQFSQGTFMALSAAGGAAVALGFPLLFEATEHQSYTVAAMLGGWGGLVLGENLSLKIFEKSGKDRQSLHLDLPVLWQWPLLVSSIEYSKKGHNLDRVVPKAELISIEF
jgi:hypothetical protein